MKDYILKRLLLMIPTLFGITLITFLVIQLAPGSPVESRMSVDQGIKSDQVTKQIVEQTKNSTVSTSQFTRGTSSGYARSRRLISEILTRTTAR